MTSPRPTVLDVLRLAADLIASSEEYSGVIMIAVGRLGASRDVWTESLDAFYHCLPEHTGQHMLTLDEKLACLLEAISDLEAAA